MQEEPVFVSIIIRALQSSVKPDSRPAETASSNLHIVLAFCLIGLLLTLCGILRFSELGIAQYNQF